ncbi:MAG: ribonuclease P protein component [Clostridia bacterium]|nr:ribonuclease P protein component [Clostridia bacterium]
MLPVETLKTNSDFRRAYARGKSYTNPALVMYVRKNRAGSCRIGITASKKIGNAVQRNRARRVIREAFRQVNLPLKGNYDVVFVARTKTVYKKSTEIYNVMLPMLIEAGVVKNEELRA